MSPRSGLTWICALVDMIDEPGEGPGVEGLCHGVPILFGLVELERDLGHVPPDVDLTQEDDLEQ